MPTSTTPDERFALRQIDGRQGAIAWREAGQGLPLVLLHGIGSGSGSWLGQFEGLASSFRVIAWDAPGYGGSAPLSTPTPLAGDYAQVLAELIEALGLKEAAVLGHSLGAIVAGAWAADTSLSADTQRHALLLASPARGYGQATPAVRSAKYRERLDLLERLGIEGLAAQRSAGLCAPGASAEVIAAVRLNMARATVGGYAQAAHLLAHDDLLTHLRRVKVPIGVLCGELDRVTPPDACAELARAVGAPYRPLRGVAHACYVEDPAQFNAAVREALRTFVPAPQGAGHV